MISWKHSFKRLSEEYKLAQKKKQALDNLFENGKISQATRDSFDNDINSVIMEIEKQQNALLAKMQDKTQELESQIKTLEKLLANYEIQHVVGEIDEEMYQREITLISTGLESARHELNVIKEATSQLCPPVEAPTTETAPCVEENEVEAAQSEPTEAIIDAPAEVEAPEVPISQETAVNMEETASESPTIENAYVAPEDTPQIVEETPEISESQPEITEEIPLSTEDVPQEAEWQPQVTEDISQEIDENAEITEEATEATEESSQNVEEIDINAEVTEEISQPEEEMPQPTESEPQTLEETLQTVEETPTEVYPSEESKEAPQETSVETVSDEEKTEAENTEAVEADEEAEYEEL